MLIHQELLAILHYDPATGQFVRLKSLSRTGRWLDCNEPIQGVTYQGYLDVCVNRNRYRAHRLAWFYMTGVWPNCNIDHKDGNRSNNTWNNLRLATGSLNQINCKLHRHNTSGHRGVSWSNRFGKWVAYVYIKNKQKRLGYFHSLEDAIVARQNAEVQYYGPASRIQD